MRYDEAQEAWRSRAEATDDLDVTSHRFARAIAYLAEHLPRDAWLDWLKSDQEEIAEYRQLLLWAEQRPRHVRSDAGRAQPRGR